MITIGAIPDPTAMGLKVQANVMIEVEPGMVESVAVVLGDHGEVGYLATTTGRFNLSAAISVASGPAARRPTPTKPARPAAANQGRPRLRRARRTRSFRLLSAR